MIILRRDMIALCPFHSPNDVSFGALSGVAQWSAIGLCAGGSQVRVPVKDALLGYRSGTCASQPIAVSLSKSMGKNILTPWAKTEKKKLYFNQAGSKYRLFHESWGLGSFWLLVGGGSWSGHNPLEPVGVHHPINIRLFNYWGSHPSFDQIWVQKEFREREPRFPPSSLGLRAPGSSQPADLNQGHGGHPCDIVCDTYGIRHRQPFDRTPHG